MQIMQGANHLPIRPEYRRFCASMHPRHTIRPEYKKALTETAGLFYCSSLPAASSKLAYSGRNIKQQG
ncbi:MAG TPA: hypothetical protein VIM59_20490 [Cellvibrio sp.]